MSLASEYQRQRAWRQWPAIFDALPPMRERTVLDLGCAVGDQAAELVARGARVIGIDANDELLDAARARRLPNAEFRKGDLRDPGDLTGLDGAADAVWCSFAAAYFIDLGAVLERWGRFLRPGGWIALTEIDDMFGHEPLGARAKELLDGYARDALAAGRYDFHMGRKLEAHLVRAGFAVTKSFALEDRELAFRGPAEAEVVAAWRARFDRMQLLRDRCGAEFEPLRDEFLSCLTRADHRPAARVVCCIATR